MKVPIEAQIKCAERELGMRRRVYPRWVDNGRMTQQQMRHEIECMEAIVATLKTLPPDAPGLF